MRTKVDDVTEALSRLVESGTWVPGIRLPSAELLANDFRVSRGTIRSALNRLLGSGLISKHGNGWYVAQKAGAETASRANSLPGGPIRYDS